LFGNNDLGRPQLVASIVVVVIGGVILLMILQVFTFDGADLLLLKLGIRGLLTALIEA
jgi:hypothetical protein